MRTAPTRTSRPARSRRERHDHLSQNRTKKRGKYDYEDEINYEPSAKGEDGFAAEGDGRDYEKEKEEDRPYGRTRPNTRRVKGFSNINRTEVRRIAAIGGRAGTTPRARRKAAAAHNGRTRKTPRPRGFAAMSKSEVRRIASMGGRASHGGGRPPKRKRTRLAA